MIKRVRITTVDNPYDTFEDFENWFMLDIEKGYYSCSKLARITETNDSMTEKEENEEIERAIDRLIELDPCDLYTKVYKEEDDMSEDIDESMGGWV